MQTRGRTAWGLNSRRSKTHSSASFPFDSIRRSIVRPTLGNPVPRKFSEVVLLGRTNVVLFGPEWSSYVDVAGLLVHLQAENPHRARSRLLVRINPVANVSIYIYMSRGRSVKLRS